MGRASPVKGVFSGLDFAFQDGRINRMIMF